jgi:putative intracellular protease/amidase
MRAACLRSFFMARVLLPLPDRDFDITEVAVPWRKLRDAGHEFVFATEQSGVHASGDPLLLTGVIFGQLGAEPEPKLFYQEMIKSAEFGETIAWHDIEPKSFDALVLPGGHAPGMRQYLGSGVLQEKVAAFWELERPVAAICHGVLLLARAQRRGRSVLEERETTCLPKYLERLAYYSTAWKLGRYYRTYPAYVEDEVRDVLRDSRKQFHRGPIQLSERDTDADSTPAFLVEDRNYLSARWPGDAYAFSRRLIEML